MAHRPPAHHPALTLERGIDPESAEPPLGWGGSSPAGFEAGGYRLFVQVIGGMTLEGKSTSRDVIFKFCDLDP